jgi:hypothetical protein
MPYVDRELHPGKPKIAASAIRQGEPVRLSASQTDYVLPAATSNAPVFGLAIATAASPGDPVGVQESGVAIGRACASLGPGALIVVGSTNGRLAPLGAAASAPIPQGLHVIGRSVGPAVDGDYFSVHLRPDNQ